MTARKQPTILLTGVNGQVGFELMRSLQGLGNVVALDRSALDLSDLKQVARVVREIKPGLIMNPAAYTAVDAAESDVSGAMRINAEAPGVLAEEALRIGAVLIHYSTDYVFDGTKSIPYIEEDQVNPQNIYGKSKLAGEQAIAAVGCPHLIFRTSWVYGSRGKNFLRTMLRLGAERDELSVVADQVGAPTWSVTIAAMSAQILAQSRVADEREWWEAHSGIYNLTSAGATSWCGFAEAIFAHAHLPNKPIVKPIPTTAYPTPAARPANSRLSSAKLVQTFGLEAPDWEQALRLCLAGQ
ncbi:dTDP-4-dehydrorhamnose reductase [Burkholderia sp. FL-7-2-10-S1-D7]|uniref:dTDP-4-dehydrorhamnose reductase n=1 Tax=Burkholderia sp. FL-7-2-10-S1-D7 TaxID=1637866 RepID=UPI0007537CA3|nr:dTDP-4-dehydrorhamnose reductase [Burkholderia sp. FL-7-2-10-S1-D7]KVF74430.1 dTDP-4-dehydrorhamnose reductase [Burkholderia sp. FL-7-2-10-S1-D7]